MRVITNLIRKLKGFEKSIPDILREGIEENQEIILDYNTEAQLYEEGITGITYLLLVMRLIAL